MGGCGCGCGCGWERERERERISRHGFTWILRQEDRKFGEHEYQIITLLNEWYVTYVTAIQILGGAFNACCMHFKYYPLAPRLGHFITSYLARLVKFKWSFPCSHRQASSFSFPTADKAAWHSGPLCLWLGHKNSTWTWWPTGCVGQ